MGSPILRALGRQKPRRTFRVIKVSKLATLGLGDFADPSRREQADPQSQPHRAGNRFQNDPTPKQAKLAVTQDPAPNVLGAALPKARTWIGPDQISVDSKAEDGTDEGLHSVRIRGRTGCDHTLA
jgi:hypothetical protein